MDDKQQLLESVGISLPGKPVQMTVSRGLYNGLSKRAFNGRTPRVIHLVKQSKMQGRVYTYCGVRMKGGRWRITQQDHNCGDCSGKAKYALPEDLTPDQKKMLGVNKAGRP